MKKNKWMRLASVLLVLCLATTCVVSGTYAKYVTTNSGSDSARVAKWGVSVAVNDDLDLFKSTYSKDTTADIGSISYTVTSANGTDQIVAPGTTGSMTFSISGTPEVATNVAFSFTPTKTIHLAAGEYTLEAGKYMAAAQTVTTTADYEPIYFYLYEGTTRPASPTKLTLSGLDAALESYSANYAPNTNLEKTYTLEWVWDYAGTFTSASGITDVTNYADFLDTYLGDEATLQTEEFSFSITVTQID